MGNRKVTKKLVQDRKKKSRSKEVAAICGDWQDLQEDVRFLAERSMRCATISFVDPRDVGASSNSIVAIAYGLQKLQDQEMPSDVDDLGACMNMWEKLPKHRKTKAVRDAMSRAIITVDKKYPGQVPWKKVP